MPFEDVFHEIVSSAFAVPDKRDWRSKRAILGLVIGGVFGAVLGHSTPLIFLVMIVFGSGIAGYLLGVMLYDLLFWVLFAIAVASGVTAFFFILGSA